MSRRVGFTGSQNELPIQQKHALACLLWDFYAANYREFHHGDCINADAFAHYVTLSQGYNVHVHPPENRTKRAFCLDASVTYPPKPYLERNRDIVNASEVLVAAPSTQYEQLRSGTWATVRYARKACIPILLVFPTGKVYCDDRN